MTDKQFSGFCNEMGIPELYRNHEVLKGSFSYQAFDLRMAIDGFKQAIYDSLPGWFKSLSSRLFEKKEIEG